MWPFSKKELPEIQSKSHIVDLDHGLSSLINVSYNGATPTSALSIYENSSAVYIPVDLISETFSSIVPVLKIGDELIEDHPALESINNPGGFFTQKLLLKSMAVNQLVTGESFMVLVGNVNRAPLELAPMSPASVSSVEAVDGAPANHLIYGHTMSGNYLRINDGKRTRFIDGNLRELLHIRNFSTRHNSTFRGQSPLIAASKEAKQHILGGLHNANILEKGGKISLVFHFQEDMDDDQFQEAKKRVRSQYGGTKGESIGVTAGPHLDIKNIGTTNVDMDFNNLQNTAKQAVFLTYRVPLALLTTDAATLDNYRQAMTSLYDLATLPLADTIFGGMSRVILPRYGLDPSEACITYDKRTITALATRTLDELQKRVSLNLETDNELRPILGRDPIGADGDVIRKPANLIPINSELFTSDPVLNSDNVNE